ncbi:hypothetical protein [Paenibacillus cellulosilyticus]|uniref:hypothetical protein n=1 Tax=Paenibacillus cellulosilyticus TaxID=375489 RepID=UPI001FE4F01F|nr:hypothetical protein [Paenibacillus cellulosilyticus]
MLDTILSEALNRDESGESPLEQFIDWFVMLLTGSLLLLWIYRALYNWLHAPPGMKRLRLGKGGEWSADESGVQVLEANGYIVSSGKHRVPIQIGWNGNKLHSRLYIDYIAERDGKMYVVKCSRERQPMEWTGSGIRDRLMVYALLLPESSGVLYVDTTDGTVHQITFNIGVYDRE